MRKLDKPQNVKLKEFVDSMLETDWSPEQIASILRDKSPEGISETISHESVYDYIYHHTKKQRELYLHLRTARNQRQRKFSRKSKTTIKDRVSIHARPIEITKKKEYGHWETDLVEFGRLQSGVLSVKYKRKAMLCRLHKLESKRTQENEDGIVETIESLPNLGSKVLLEIMGKKMPSTWKHYKTLEYRPISVMHIVAGKKAGLKILTS